uniref:Conotoxin n=1 Tax=Conus geographus TaxID=6491 RepID=X5IH20_CONGE|nr:G113_VD_Superfamily_T_precursor_conopeptide [Conus geographus]
MLCLPVFIILLLLASPAAPKPFETKLPSDLTRADVDIDMAVFLEKLQDACCKNAPEFGCCTR